MDQPNPIATHEHQTAPLVQQVAYPHIGITPSVRDKMVSKRVFGTSELVPADPVKHANILGPLCELCALKHIFDVPRTMIAKSPIINASVTGDGTLIVSEGMSETLNRDETRAMIMHELTHYKTRDRNSVLGHAFGFVADLVAGLFAGKQLEKMFSGKQVPENHSWLRKTAAHGLPALGVHYLVVAPAHAYFKRQGEYHADLEGAKTVGFDNMIGVLKFFDEMNEKSKHDTPRSRISRIRDHGVLDMMAAVLFPFAEHPTFEERIQRLEEERRKYPDNQITSVAEHRQNAPSTPSIH